MHACTLGHVPVPARTGEAKIGYLIIDLISSAIGGPILDCQEGTNDYLKSMYPRAKRRAHAGKLSLIIF